MCGLSSPIKLCWASRKRPLCVGKNRPPVTTILCRQGSAGQPCILQHAGKPTALPCTSHHRQSRGSPLSQHGDEKGFLVCGNKARLMSFPACAGFILCQNTKNRIIHQTSSGQKQPAKPPRPLPDPHQKAEATAQTVFSPLTPLARATPRQEACPMACLSPCLPRHAGQYPCARSRPASRFSQ